MTESKSNKQNLCQLIGYPITSRLDQKLLNGIFGVTYDLDEESIKHSTSRINSDQIADN